MKESILLIGGGGHCRSCIDVIESTGEYQIAGIIDIKDNLGTNILGYEVIGIDADIPLLVGRYKNVLITVGQIKNPELRIRLYNEADKSGADFPVIVSPTSYLSGHADVKNGTIIMHNGIVNSGAVIGKNCIVNTSSVIEHDVNIGDNCHISTACVVNGSCVIGKNVFIVSNSVVLNNITLCDNVVVGAGSVVNKNISESGVYAGNPLRKINDI